jgi:para-aminobenzoate synthetase/4-amino-4-deoxychorismate lyase
VERARLLADGQLRERVITVEELGMASEVATLSSLRGWRSARPLAVCRCGSAVPL